MCVIVAMFHLSTSLLHEEDNIYINKYVYVKKIINIIVLVVFISKLFLTDAIGWQG